MDVPDDPNVLKKKLTVGYTPKTFIGGFVSMLIEVCLTMYVIFRLMTILYDREHAFSTQSIFYSTEQMNEMEVTLGKYNNSANFVFGLTGGNVSAAEDSENFVDILNNPYVRYVGL